jgi:hypothetical protein
VTINLVPQLSSIGKAGMAIDPASSQKRPGFQLLGVDDHFDDAHSACPQEQRGQSLRHFVPFLERLG